MTAAIELEPWEGLEGLLAALEPWADLARDLPPAGLCNRPDWVRCHAEAYSPPHTIFGWTARDPGGRVLGVLPFRAEPSRGPLALRRAILVQDGTFESDYLELPLRPGHEEAVLARLLDIFRRRRGTEALVLACLAPEAPATRALERVLAARGLPLRRHEVGCAAADLPDTFEAFLAGLPKRMRSKVRSARRRAAEAGAACAWCDDPAALPAHLAGLYELHGLRWREAGHGGSFDDPRRRRFYELLMPRLLAAGRLRFARLDLDGGPVAYQIGALAGDTYYQLQEGYHPDHADRRVGVALRGWCIERLIEEGVRRYDFMAGLSRHKTDWGAANTACRTLAFPVRGLRARAAYALRAALDRRRG